MHRASVVILVLVGLSWAAWTPLAYAQRGMGDSIGVARQGIVPKLTNLSGELLGIETHPCEKTTGYGIVGTHLVIETENGKELTIDLGLATGVEWITKRLSIGQKLEATVFRTEKMPKKQYVAKSLTVNGKTVQLRNESLRPFWAGGRATWEGSRGRGGYGPGQGWGGYGRGPGQGWDGYGRGPSQGRGGGWGRGGGAGWNAGYCPRYGWR